MKEGRKEVINIVGIEYIDEGKSLRFEIIDSIPPYSTSFLTFKNVCVAKIFQCSGEEFPTIVIDLFWQSLCENEKEKILSDHDFPFVGLSGELLVPSGPMVIAHLEGSIVGDVIAESVIINSQDEG